MDNNLVILISGTSKGIGKCLAEHYISKNYSVIGCSRSVPDINAPNYKHFKIDINDEENVKAMMTCIKKDFKKLDVLINNAGVKLTTFAVLSSEQAIRESFNTNVIGAFLLCRESIKLMSKNKFGRIINMTSIAVPLASQGSAIYSATKAALEQFSKVLAREVAHDKITVNNIGLSFVKEGGMIDSVEESERAKILENTLFKTETGMDDITNAIDFLISPASKMITGQTIYIGGV